ncbi:hypothetical protein [Thiomicrospira microaerophila]|uniref:hypothetical protein n=1 Tax=Thiomicrospira microaerophila TaxID=406020 RepID=UPI0005C8B58B|nr:hypothetical protein [Thiomicrospira microaerophila]
MALLDFDNAQPQPQPQSDDAQEQTTTPQNWFRVETATHDNALLSQIQKKRSFGDDYKKLTIDINRKLADDLGMQPCTVAKSVPALLEFALAELRRQNKMLVIDFEQ